MTPNCTMRRTRGVTQRNYIIRPHTFQDATRSHTRYCARYPFCYVCEDTACAWHSGATSAATIFARTRLSRIRRRRPGSPSSPRWPRKPWIWSTHDRRSSLARGPYCQPFTRRRSFTRLARSIGWSSELQVSWNYSMHSEHRVIRYFSKRGTYCVMYKYESHSLNGEAYIF